MAWKQATSLKPTHSVAWNNMIVMLDSMGLFNLNLTISVEIIITNLVKPYQICLVLGEWDKAQSLASEALAILPNDSALHFNLANTLGKKGHYENAEQHFLKAIQLKDKQALYHTNLGEF